YQGGTSLDTAVITATVKGYNAEDLVRNVKPGASLTLKEAFTLTSSTGSVEVDVTPTMSLDDSQKLVKTFDLSKLK
ncbi:MAG: DUF5067 domain-containing protein, partial [Clostridia bacterium]|nr:DUF5067 domain-containing protein [Clostridia bacterium]